MRRPSPFSVVVLASACGVRPKKCRLRHRPRPGRWRGGGGGAVIFGCSLFHRKKNMNLPSTFDRQLPWPGIADSLRAYQSLRELISMSVGYCSRLLRNA